MKDEEIYKIMAGMDEVRRGAEQTVPSESSGSPRYFEGDLEPKDGDWVRWRSNGERWMVSAQDDIDNPRTALSAKEWHDEVIFEKRP